MTALDPRWLEIVCDWLPLAGMLLVVGVVAIGIVYIAYCEAKQNAKRIDMGDDYTMNNDKEIKK